MKFLVVFKVGLTRSLKSREYVLSSWAGLNSASDY